MIDKSDTIAFQVREDGFKSKIDKKDTNNDTAVGNLELPIEELCKASGNKLWYRLSFPQVGSRPQNDAISPAELQILPVFVPRSKVIDGLYAQKNSDEMVAQHKANAILQDEFNSERKQNIQDAKL